MRCEAESKKLSLYPLSTVTMIKMISLLHLESICLSKQPPAPLQNALCTCCVQATHPTQSFVLSAAFT